MKAARAGVIGDPIGHSLSPEIFRVFSEGLGRPVEYTRERVPSGGLRDFLARAQTGGWVGFNVTLPHKEAVTALLGELDGTARAAGAVNAVSLGGGKAVGHNTDAAGFLAPISRLGYALAGKRAVVLGAGGAARAVCLALKSSGAEVAVCNRHVERAKALASALGVRASEKLTEEVAAADVVVNATSAGMDGRSNPLPDGARLRRGALAYDLVYRPARTLFLIQAASEGAKTQGGLAMLVAQAAAAWRIWFDEDVPAEVADRAESALVLL